VGALGPTGFVGPAGELPTIGTPDFNTLLQSIAAAIAIFRPFEEPREGGFRVPGLLDPLPQPDFERIVPGPLRRGTPMEVALERVAPGGTVNVPVVLGATGDPSGTRRPRFPDEGQLEAAEAVGRLVANLLALRKARQNADKQRRAFENFLAARLDLLRRATMPFGQSGSQFVAPGGALIPGIGGVIGGLLPGLIERFLPQLPGFGPEIPQLPPGIPGLSPPMGGGGACPPLLRGGAPAGFRMSPVPWFPVQAPNGKWFFFGHLGTPTFSKLKGRRRHHHHSRKR